VPQQCDRRICAGVRSCQRRTTILVWQTTTSNCSPSWTGRAAALPSLQSIPELVRVRRQASGLMSMPDDTSGAAKLSRLGRILNVTDVRIAVRGPCRPRRFHPPSACEFSRDFISLPVLKKGTALLPTESPRARISSGSACPDPYKKYPKPPQFDPITARHCGGNL
jgi:hypothetical protein